MTEKTINADIITSPIDKRAGSGGRRRNSRQEEQRRQTKQALLTAAIDVFSERGYLDTSVEHVLASAGVSRAAFYAQFDSKLALICVLAGDFEPKWRPMFEQLMVLSDPTVADLERWAILFIEFHEANKVICGLLTQVAGLEDRLYWLLAGQRDALIDNLGRHFDAFRRAAEDPAIRLRARLLLYQIDETCFLIVRGRVPDPGRNGPRLIAEQIHAFLAE